jgi:hypothetical protein
MAEPTLKDVLNAIAELRKGQASLENGQAELRAEMASSFEDVRADIAAHRKETRKGVADLDAELAKHADPLHRKLEARVAH